MNIADLKDGVIVPIHSEDRPSHTSIINQENVGAVVLHAFNPSTWEAKTSGSEFKVSCDYIGSSRPDRTTK